MTASRSRILRWLSTAAGLFAFVGTLIVAAPSPAQAIVIPKIVTEYVLISKVPTFNVADGRSVINTLDTPISATFTSQQSRRFSVSTSAGVQASFFKFLTVSVSANATLERTTAIGVNATLTVPPTTRVVGEYGVEAFEVVYEVHRLNCNFKPCRHLLGSPFEEARNVPTIIEGWRFSSAPV